MERPDSLPSRCRLLIVEDELTTLFALREFFALADFEVDCAVGREEAFGLLARQCYDAVITDLHLTPGHRSEGLSIAAHARRKNPLACVVMLTAYGSESAQEEARRCGVNLLKAKPVELPRLTLDIQEVLRGQHVDVGH